jgi:hypothetical protein
MDRDEFITFFFQNGVAVDYKGDVFVSDRDELDRNI